MRSDIRESTSFVTVYIVKHDIKVYRSHVDKVICDIRESNV